MLQNNSTQHSNITDSILCQ